MSRVPSTPVQVCVKRRWYTGVLRSCEVSEDGASCTGVVSFVGPNGVQTGRFPAVLMRAPSGEPGCPAEHDDLSCGTGRGAVASSCC